MTFKIVVIVITGDDITDDKEDMLPLMSSNLKKVKKLFPLCSMPLANRSGKASLGKPNDRKRRQSYKLSIYDALSPRNSENH